MKRLYSIGTGSQARYVIDLYNNRYPLKGLVEILNKDNVGKKINGIEVICYIDEIEKFIDKNDSDVIIAYGDNKKKKEIADILSKKGYDFPTIIGDNTYISSFVDMGKGCIINPNVTIMPNTKIGNHVIIHSGSVIEHDNEIGDYVNIAPGVFTAGNVKIGEESYIYTGAILIPKIKIGKRVIVGAGSVVIKDIADDTTVIGNPAREIKK